MTRRSPRIGSSRSTRQVHATSLASRPATSRAPDSVRRRLRATTRSTFPVWTVSGHSASPWDSVFKGVSFSVLAYGLAWLGRHPVWYVRLLMPGERFRPGFQVGPPCGPALTARGESRSYEGSTQSIRRTTLTRMAMGTRETDQPPLWIATSDLPTSPGHPFYARLTTLLDGHHFDRFVEGLWVANS